MLQPVTQTPSDSQNTHAICGFLVVKTIFFATDRRTLCDIAQELRLEDEFAFLVFLARLVGLVVFPTYRLLALSAGDVADDVLARRHIALVRFAGGDVDDVAEEVRLSVLTSEISTDDVFKIRQVGFALFTAVDLVAVEIDVIG